MLAAVAAGSRSDRSSQAADPGERELSTAFWDYAVTLGLIALVATLFLAVYLKVPVRGPRSDNWSFVQLLGILLIVGLVAIAGARMRSPQTVGEEGVADVLVGNERAGEVIEERPAAQEQRRLRLQWPVLFGAGVLALAGIGLYAVQRRRRTLGLPASTAASALSEAIDESVDDLRAEQDGRRAVIAAYARMEQAIEYHGLPRRRAEAPLEYLARVLRELRVRSSAVLALTELFERAKFSRHEIDADMKEEAIDALLAVRDDLRAPAEAPAA